MSTIALATAVAVAGASLLTPTSLPPERPVTTRHHETVRHTGGTHQEVDALPAERATGRVHLEFANHGIELVLDDAEEELHLTARPDYNAEFMRRIVCRLETWGYELMGPDECPVEALDDGRTRIYLADARMEDAWR